MTVTVAQATLNSGRLNHCPRVCRWIDFNLYAVSLTAPIQNTVVQYNELQGRRCGSGFPPPNMPCL